MKNKLFLLLLLVQLSTLSLTTVAQPSRSMASLSCRAMLGKLLGDKNKALLEYADKFPDPFVAAQLRSLRKDLADNSQLKSPVEITSEMQAFRESVLPILKYDQNVSEGLVRSMEAELRMRSSRLAETLSGGIARGYDYVIIGAGVHGVIALHRILRNAPDSRVLIVEASDTVAANFRYAGDTFRINSSNRASGEDLPLPGRGNINELPGLPVQLSDISANKYPSAGDLARVLVAGLYAGVSQSKNVDVLFDTQVSSL